MRILIAEDEGLLARRLQKMVTVIFPNAEFTVTATVAESVKFLKNNTTPDLIFLDIELADGKSFEIFEEVTVTSPVFFTTAYDEYALKAFKVNSIDYLLKPIKQVDIENAISKLNQLRHSDVQNIYRWIGDVRQQKELVLRERILVKQGQKMISINIDEAALFFTQNTVTFLLTKSKQKYIVDYTLDQIEQTLDAKKFYRVNRQYIICYDIITAVHPWFNGKLKIDTSLGNSDPIVVSRDKASILKKWLGQ